MYYTQNIKIAHVSESTMVIGVDIGSEWNFARAFDWRGVELTRKVFGFSNTLDGYHLFDEWAVDWQTKSGKADIILGEGGLVLRHLTELPTESFDAVPKQPPC